MKENLSAIRRVKKQLNLCEASFALAFHCTPPDILAEARVFPLAQVLAGFPLTFGEPQPLSESISSAGGLSLDELDDQFMLKSHPGFFAAGEMLHFLMP